GEGVLEEDIAALGSATQLVGDDRLLRGWVRSRYSGDDRQGLAADGAPESDRDPIDVRSIGQDRIPHSDKRIPTMAVSHNDGDRDVTHSELVIRMHGLHARPPEGPYLNVTPGARLNRVILRH